MHIKSIKLTNFRCFKESEINFSKLTLLTGANSSGKSSVINSILCQMQSDNFPYNLTLNGRYVQLGDYIDVVFKHSKRRSFILDLKLSDVPSEITFKSTWNFDKSEYMPKLKDLESRTDIAKIHLYANSKCVCNINLKLPKQLDEKQYKRLYRILYYFNKAIAPIAKDPKSRRQTTTSDLKRQLKEIMAKKPKRFSYIGNNITQLTSKLTNAKNIFLQNELFKISHAMERCEKWINYISSFRHFPERVYFLSYKRDLRIGKYGENYIYQMLNWEHQSSKKFTQLVSALRSLGVVNQLRCKIIRGGRVDYRVRVSKGGTMNSLSDVGYGISQLLPILVADLQLPSKDSTLMLSQPEIHLHPEVQARLANYFFTNMDQLNKRYIIETHSEYLLNRIRLLIAQRKLKEKDVKIYFFSNIKDEAKVYEIKFTKSGKIVNAPEEFFKTYMMDVMNIAMNAK